MQTNLNQTWDLDVIFPGGSTSTSLQRHLEELEKDIAIFQADTDKVDDSQSIDKWVQLLETLQALSARLREAGAFVVCLNAQNVKDQEAKLLQGRVSQISASYISALNVFDGKLLGMSDDSWRVLIEDDRVDGIRFNLQERRERAELKLDPARESMISDLSVDGYSAWGQMYTAIVGRMKLPFEVNGDTKQLSMGQAANKLMDPDRDVREAVFKEWEAVWGGEAELCGNVLNRIAGYRLAVYKHRGWDSFLQEPLDYNRMTQKTLDVMWDVIERNKAPFVEYLQRKAKLFGVEKLSWHDVAAPLSTGTAAYTYEQARDFVVEQFSHFDPKMAEFAAHCIDNRWVEAEDREDKGTGAFCTSFPISEQTRVFMTFSGTYGNVTTLAHELGHAYHQHVMRGVPRMAQGYAMNVAETASTFAETIVGDAGVKNAKTDAERIALLEDKVQQAATMFMNIHARFLFETRFYEQRRKGMLGVDQLNELMVQAQKDAFDGALGAYHPHFWASKQHFYATGVPFYNFPYTFGYLFSNGIYSRALEEGPSFANKYVALLRDTGRMRVEDLARKHLDVDLTQPDFWQRAVDVAVRDAKEFLEITK